MESISHLTREVLKHLEVVFNPRQDGSHDRAFSFQFNNLILLAEQRPAPHADLFCDLASNLSTKGILCIRVPAPAQFHSPFHLVQRLRSALPDIDRGLPEPQAELWDLIRRQFIHRLTVPADLSECCLDGSYRQFTRVDEQLSPDATVGLIDCMSRHLTDRLRQYPAALFIEEIDLYDTWSVSFIAHLVRHSKDLPICVCTSFGGKAKPHKKAIAFLRAKLPGAVLAGVPGQQSTWRAETVDRLCPLDRMLLQCLSIADSSSTLAELQTLVNSHLREVDIRERLELLKNAGIVHISNQGDISIADSHLKRILYSRVPDALKRRIHLQIAEKLRAFAGERCLWNWRVGEKINAFYAHLVRGGNWLAASQYHRVYYSANANTYLQHVTANFRELHRSIQLCDQNSRLAKIRIAYQLATDVVRRPGEYREKTRWCHVYLKTDSEPYERAHVYAGLCVLHANTKTAEGYSRALECSQAAYQEAASIPDIQRRLHANAIVHNARALLHFRLGENSEACDKGRQALNCLSEAGRLPGWQTLSRMVVLSSMAQVSSADKDYQRALAVYEEVVAEAKAEKNTEALIAALVGEGKVLRKTGQYERAIGCFEQCINLASTNPLLISLQMFCEKATGLCWKSLDAPDRAAHHLKQSLSIAMSIADLAEIAFIHLQLGLCHFRTGDLDGVVSDLHTAFQIYSELHIADQAGYCAHQLAVVRVAHGDYRGAAQLFEQASDMFRSVKNEQQALVCLRAALQCRVTLQERSDQRLLRWALTIATDSEELKKPHVSGFMETYRSYAALFQARHRSLSDAVEEVHVLSHNLR
jgi:tetratricopeptide (TPR) repeat protein